MADFILLPTVHLAKGHIETVRLKDRVIAVTLISPRGPHHLPRHDALEHLVMPKFAKDYYGPSAALRTALTKDENTWRMIHREAVENDYAVTTKTGTLERRHPDVRVRTEKDTATFVLTGGINFVPMTFTGLSSPRNFKLTVDGVPLDQSIHGSDFWQTDYDPETRTWSRTYNIPPSGQKIHRISLAPNH